jgi:hypothetical protein
MVSFGNQAKKPVPGSHGMFSMLWGRSVVALKKPTAQNPCGGYSRAASPTIATRGPRVLPQR